ncbi:hypothetical protein CGRA01v4_14768 [Colletotrichum graminicola]|nr:hypothetical protein CGRA01v4_14768 [Colletotrichum graminicola]
MIIVSGTCAYATNPSRYLVTVRNGLIPERHILVGCCLAEDSRCSRLQRASFSQTLRRTPNLAAQRYSNTRFMSPSSSS